MVKLVFTVVFFFVFFYSQLSVCDSLCRRVVELVFPGAAEAGLNAAVLPQPLDDAGQLARHEAFLRRAGQHKQLPRVVLKTKKPKKKITSPVNATLPLSSAAVCYRGGR